MSRSASPSPSSPTRLKDGEHGWYHPERVAYQMLSSDALADEATRSRRRQLRHPLLVMCDGWRDNDDAHRRARAALDLLRHHPPRQWCDRLPSRLTRRRIQSAPRVRIGSFSGGGGGFSRDTNDRNFIGDAACNHTPPSQPFQVAKALSSRQVAARCKACDNPPAPVKTERKRATMTSTIDEIRRRVISELVDVELHVPRRRLSRRERFLRLLRRR
jgi:hypothetical protein